MSNEATARFLEAIAQRIRAGDIQVDGMHIIRGGTAEVDVRTGWPITLPDGTTTLTLRTSPKE
ncbi:hypothetical protein [Deinococcus peraridilitoris]|uniref:Uncharacterized protein n=1 Tax=Deinococcus peraridilitoris (strain DSM 19664 / LMG 22246 / CIP 109416 / KR-200) TaxID=937777 RepID=K9ZWX6_DEIPD|nr:hypothetical protein [Deinococcus peraridilitoris]AFZ66076.1 hypothetical protein Deipe_0480 [Deinococcus peraridilitoris DSM 19664]